MKLSIIAIGDELLIGQVTDTNTGSIARMLAPHGWQVTDTQVVADDAEAIRRAIDRAFETSRVVITTGGLGPTKDDITKTTLRDIFGGEMRLDPATLDNVKEVVAKRGLALNELTAAQAIVPTSCQVIQNRVGTAPIMWFEDPDGRVLVAMPGVPFETLQMMEQEVLPRLLKRFPDDAPVEHATLVVTGMPESSFATLLEPLERHFPPGMHLAYLPKPGYIRLRLDYTPMRASLGGPALDGLIGGPALDGHIGGPALDGLGGPALDGLGGPALDGHIIQSYFNALATRCGSNRVLALRDASLAEIVQNHLTQRGLTMATAESCTGGNIAHTLTLVPGSSAYFLGGIISYSNDVKTRVLGVSPEAIAQHGAVSIEVVEQMVEGACRVTGADCAVATSGIAGPGGAVPGKPVGTVAIAAHTPSSGTVSRMFHFPGTRDRVIDRATTEALLLLLRNLR
ncbi:MAG: nicotinamide-nucleotide amidohydrolase family protein [Bacteroidales bacterium]|nr:nicotinamide-nucleotide amidohydrolase family protein [Bacteroidales bacterium]